MRLGRKLREIFQPGPPEGANAGGADAVALSADAPHPTKAWTAEIRRLTKHGQPVVAMRLAKAAAENYGAKQEGLFCLYGTTLDRVGRHEEALAAYQHELALHPGHAEARQRCDAVAKSARTRPRRRVAPGERDWRTSLPHPLLMSIQRALPGYTYRGVPMQKNPFDIALYPLLLWQTKPRTIFEIGSKSGGSALWFADQLQTFGLDGRVHSLDIVRVDGVAHPRVTFHEGDGRQLGRTFTPEFLRQQPRPWLVIEDADHVYETSLAVLRFFDDWLQPGEYIVIEDGIASDINQDPACAEGPHRALKEFLRAHPDRYEIDGDFCDFYGHNLTWCTNGFLKRLPVW